MRRIAGGPGSVAWLATLAGLVAVAVATSVGPAARVVWERPTVLFSVVVVAASLCVATSLAVLAIAHRERTAELGLLGCALLAISVLPLVHGLTVPGVVYGPNAAVMASAFLAGPLAVGAAAPLLAPGTAASQWLVRRWRAWVAAWTWATVGVASLLLAAPDAIPAPRPGAPLTLAAAAASLAAVLALSARQLRLYWIGGRPASLVAALALVLIAVTSLVWLNERPFSLGFWILHGIDVAGVLGACAAVVLGHRAGRSVTSVLEPVVARDPLVALEAGLAPAVHRFVAALDRKDRVTRDHVVRVGELAVAVGRHVGLPAHRLRFLGLAAILHDVGKLLVDDAILAKPGRLTSDEYDAVKQHPVDGERLLAGTPSLAPAAPFVRHHHERIDGRGYPDGLAADRIPLEARIIAICDAFDAMAQTRRYREGMGNERAVSVLEEHAGSQWDARIVAAARELLLAAVDLTAFERVGSGERWEGASPRCEHCEDALPAHVRALLLSGRG